MEDFLSEVGHKILRKISKHYTKYKVIHDLGQREENSKYFAVIGAGAAKEKQKKQIKIGPDVLDLAVIGEDNQIRVTIGSWLGYTKEAMQERLLKYAQLGLIDQKTFLKLLEFGNVDEIVQQSRVESLLKRTQQQPGGPGSVPGEEDQYGLAMTENEMLVEGKSMPVDTHDDHVVHLAIHQEAFGKGVDDLVQMHMDKHQVYLGQQYGKENAPEQPVTPPGGVPEGINPLDMGRMAETQGQANPMQLPPTAETQGPPVEQPMMPGGMG
jgi:hypothetical protein